MTNELKPKQALASSINSAVAQEKAEWLKAKIVTALEHTNQKKRVNRRKASYIKVVVVLFSGIATVLLGLQIVSLEILFKNIALTLGAIVTVLNALEPFFNFRALWIEHEVALAGFHRLEDNLDFYLNGTKPENLSIEKLDEFHTKYQEIWNTLNQAWIGSRKRDTV